MSITREHLVRAAKQFGLTSESKMPAPTEATHETLTTPSKVSDVAYYTASTMPHNMHASITGATNQRSTVVTIQNKGVEVALLDKHGITDSLIRAVDLEKDVFKIPMETLINIWVTRFGNEWVDLETIDEDDFFINAYKRLKQLGHLEQHYLTDRSRYVCRKPE